MQVQARGYVEGLRSGSTRSEVDGDRGVRKARESLATVLVFVQALGNADVSLIGAVPCFRRYIAHLLTGQVRLDVSGCMLKGGGLSRFKGKRQGLIVDDRSCDASVLIPLDVSIQRLDGGAYERFGFLSTVLPLGQFQEQAAFGEEG